MPGVATPKGRQLFAARAGAVVTAGGSAAVALRLPLSACDGKRRTSKWTAALSLRLSGRSDAGVRRVLNVARTIADLAGSETIARVHIAEALSYRRIVHVR